MSFLLEGLFNGISIGAVLLIAALGLAIVFGLMGVINLAHGELMMLGAYTTYIVQNVSKVLLREFKPSPNVGWLGNAIAFVSSREMYLFYALIAAFLVTALVGLALERGVIRFLYGRPLETLLATWGVSLLLQQFVRSANWLLVISILVFCLLFFGELWIVRRRVDWERIRSWAIAILIGLSSAIAAVTGILIAQSQQTILIKPWFGTKNVDVTAPGWLRGGLRYMEIQMPYPRLFIIVLTIICLLGTYWFLNRSNWGLRIRAVTQNRTMSACLGIPTAKVDALTFALGSGLAGMAGCAISLLGSVGPNTGQAYIVDTFMVVVVGGVGNLMGTIIAALGIGILNYLIGTGTLALIVAPVSSLKALADFFLFFATNSMAKVMIFALIIAFLQVKPAGIFPPKGRTAEL